VENVEENASTQLLNINRNYTHSLVEDKQDEYLLTAGAE